MENADAVASLAALAQDSRLEVFRLLVQAGAEGLAAGDVAAKLKLAPNTLTFHFDRLREAGLVSVRRDGRSMIYAVRIETMTEMLGYLTENCCHGAPEKCAPVDCVPARAASPNQASIRAPSNCWLGSATTRPGFVRSRGTNSPSPARRSSISSSRFVTTRRPRPAHYGRASR